MVSKEVEKLLLKVQKPGRYVGGELNEVIKDKNEVDVRFLFSRYLRGRNVASRNENFVQPF